MTQTDIYNQLPDRYGQFAFFNLLKFIGAVCIAIFFHFQDHFLYELSIENPFKGIIRELSIYGYCFVEMFFIISGILFAYIYLPKIANGMSFKDFMLNRIIRFYPLVVMTTFAMYMGVFVLNCYHFNAWGISTLKHFIYDILLLNQIVNNRQYLNGPIWYITVLMVCYCIGFVFAKKQVPIWFYLFWVILGLYIQYIKGKYLIFNIAFFHQEMSRGFIAFFVGILIKPVLMYLKNFNATELNVLRSFILLFVPHYIFVYHIYNAIETTDLAALFIFPLLIIFLYDLRWLEKICTTKLIKYLGAISFDMYLWNFPIYVFLHILMVKGYMRFDVDSLWSFICFVFGLHIFISFSSHYLLKIFCCK